jgi:hypothetical protein
MGFSKPPYGLLQALAGLFALLGLLFVKKIFIPWSAGNDQAAIESRLMDRFVYEGALARMANADVCHSRPLQASAMLLSLARAAMYGRRPGFCCRSWCRATSRSTRCAGHSTPSLASPTLPATRS